MTNIELYNKIRRLYPSFNLQDVLDDMIKWNNMRMSVSSSVWFPLYNVLTSMDTYRVEDTKNGNTLIYTYDNDRVSSILDTMGIAYRHKRSSKGYMDVGHTYILIDGKDAYNTLLRAHNMSISHPIEGLRYVGTILNNEMVFYKTHPRTTSNSKYDEKLLDAIKMIDSSFNLQDVYEAIYIIWRRSMGMAHLNKRLSSVHNISYIGGMISVDDTVEYNLDKYRNAILRHKLLVPSIPYTDMISKQLYIDTSKDILSNSMYREDSITIDVSTSMM